jgi:hypothetical protein
MDGCACWHSPALHHGGHAHLHVVIMPLVLHRSGTYYWISHLWSCLVSFGAPAAATVCFICKVLGSTWGHNGPGLDYSSLRYSIAVCLSHLCGSVVHSCAVCMYMLPRGSFALCLYALEGSLVAVLLASVEISHGHTLRQPDWGALLLGPAGLFWKRYTAACCYCCTGRCLLPGVLPAVVVMLGLLLARLVDHLPTVAPCRACMCSVWYKHSGL